jgi:(4-(4-[2-(gamma-L-glutamylamino)ethyl]phenoxymethyl)furan-2-yl)methanamine synthase
LAEPVATGWDLGGAHLKVAQMNKAGRLVTAIQVPCSLWRGLDHLASALAEVGPRLAPSRRHGVTMTGELVDLFADRAEGVRQLIDAMVARHAGAEVGFYAGEAGFLPGPAGKDRPREIASANWHATAHFVAERCGSGLLIDIGSTTADIVPFAAGRVKAVGYSDEERLVAEELVYTGATRTPVMALADSVPFAGERQRLMAEYFSTTADVHRLTGELPEDADQHPTADGRGRGAEDSARRLARMLGRDLASAGMADWRRLARHLAERQRRLLQDAVDRVLSRGPIGEGDPLVGAGVGRFLLPGLAAKLGRPYRDFADLVTGEPGLREWAARAAPAAAVAALIGSA